VNLRHCPLLYIFLETHKVANQRAFLESVVGLPIIEIETNPGNRHGVIKYDAGTVVLSLNLSPASRFREDTSDGFAMAFAGGHILCTDHHGHHFLLGDCPPSVTELRLRVDNLGASVGFYRDILGLEPLHIAPDAARFATGTVPIILEHQPLAADGRRIRYDTYLLVFYTADINHMRASLGAAGLTFTGRSIGSKDIGHTIRFADPSGHRFCLYEPSEEVLTWSSGQKVREILAGR
jgi:catechol 2,3-dioxygenase-like lactoylglutathione lyase family enzyme